MEKLLKFLVKGITGSEDFAIQEEFSQALLEKNKSQKKFEESEGEWVNYAIEASPSIMGLIIGKNGKTIRAIRNLIRVRATLERKKVSVSVTEKEE